MTEKAKNRASFPYNALLSTESTCDIRLLQLTNVNYYY